MVEHVIIGILIVLCAVLAGTALKNSNYADEWKAHHEIAQLAYTATKNDLADEREQRQAAEVKLEQGCLDLAELRNELSDLTKDYGVLAEENSRLYGENVQLSTLLEKQAKRLEKYEPKKVVAVAKKAVKAPAKAVAKKKTHGQHELA